MNYGKFFRLNKHLSRIEDGFAIYDYIDLPAYFTPSKDNLMSPKYPISVMIMGDSVAFKLHYSAYKIEKVSKQDAQDESIKGYSNYPQYIYNIEAPSLISENKIKGGDTTKIVHMEEIILELPFTDTVGRSLSDTIRDIYDTQFPLVQRDNSKDSNLSSKEKSSGGRYLEKLIRTRYLEEKVDEVKDVNSHFYESLRKISDGTASYSTLWLMGLVKGDKNDVRYRRTDKKGNVIGFLRKLLLDFMFDLKHSDVFQNSANYQKMYSGLMSDFYFSALMHKCEYYYYRDLVTKEMAKEDGMTVDDKKRILTLYGDNLRKTEESWTQDIMNPVSEKYFEYSFGNTHEVKKEKKDSIQQTWIEKIKGWGVVFVQKCKSPKNSIDKFLVTINVLEDNKLINRDSWFAEPEEEMRRVCFPMDGEGNLKHICNVELMVNCLSVSNSESLAHTEYVNNNREKISRWFLRRYDFNDVCHLHLSRWANFVTFAFLLASLFFFVAFDFKKLTELDFGPDNVRIVYYLLSCLLLIAMFFGMKRHIAKKKKDLLHTYIKKNCERITVFVVLMMILPIGLLLDDMNTQFINDYNIFYIIIALFVVSMFFKSFRDWVGNSLEHITSYLHLLFPRLVASITTAWLTMSVGFDLYVAFFDRHVSRSTAGMILIIVFIFVMYELNRITPRSNIWKKLFRSLQLVTISYFISLVVGTVVINFLGKQYMDRGGAFEGMTETSFTVDSLTVPIKGVVNNVSFGDSEEKRQNEYMQQQSCREGCQSIRIIQLGEHEIFFMRDFLIMFSFITMFMGIFLQMFIFEDKKMTEF